MRNLTYYYCNPVIYLPEAEYINPWWYKCFGDWGNTDRSNAISRALGSLKVTNAVPNFPKLLHIWTHSNKGLQRKWLINQRRKRIIKSTPSETSRQCGNSDLFKIKHTTRTPARRHRGTKIHADDRKGRDYRPQTATGWREEKPRGDQKEECRRERRLSHLRTISTRSISPEKEKNSATSLSPARSEMLPTCTVLVCRNHQQSINKRKKKKKKSKNRSPQSAELPGLSLQSHHSPACSSEEERPPSPRSVPPSLLSPARPLLPRFPPPLPETAKVEVETCKDSPPPAALLRKYQQTLAVPHVKLLKCPYIRGNDDVNAVSSLSAEKEQRVGVGLPGWRRNPQSID